MQLLEDVFIIENLQVLNEGRGNGPMKIRGCFQRADEANNNKRIYRRPLLEREINKLADAMSERRLLGELDHPQHDSVKLSNVSHLITALSMKGNEVIGEAEILNTPSGKVAQALIEGGVKIGVSSRGMGTVTEELDGKRYVNEDFKLITWDIVADPSTRGAYPGLTESTEIQEIIDRVLPEARKVKNFTTLLKEELTVESTPIGRERSKKLGQAVAGVIAGERAQAYGAHGGPEEKMARKYAKAAGPVVVSTDPKTQLIKTAERKSQIRGRLRKQNSSTQFINFMRDKLMEDQRRPMKEAMDDFDKATLNAEDEAKRTGKPIKLPKWEDYGPKGKISMVISQGKLHTGGKKLKISKAKKNPSIKRWNRR